MMVAANRTENTLLIDTGLQKLKPGKKLCKRGDHDVAVLPIDRRKQICESGDHPIKVVH
jgi:hypothetical protein